MLTMANSISHFAFYREYIYTGMGTPQETFHSAICFYFIEDKYETLREVHHTLAHLRSLEWINLRQVKPFFSKASLL